MPDEARRNVRPELRILRAAQEAIRVALPPLAAMPPKPPSAAAPLAVPQPPVINPPLVAPPASITPLLVTPPVAPPAPTLPSARPQGPKPPRPLSPRQMTAARELLAGRNVGEVARAMGLHPYTVTRWKRDPRFQAELRRQVSLAAARQEAAAGGATGRNTAQQKPTFAAAAVRNEPTAPAAAYGYSGVARRAILAGLPRPGNPGRDP